MDLTKIFTTILATIGIIVIVLLTGNRLELVFGDDYDGMIELGEDFTLSDMKLMLQNVEIVNQTYLDDLNEIRFKEYIGSSRYADTYISGRYNKFTDIIIIRDPTPNIFLHEVAHHVYFNHLTSLQVDEYKQIFDKSTTFMGYLTKDRVREDFADSLARYWDLEIDIRQDCVFDENCLDEIEEYTVYEAYCEGQIDDDEPWCTQGLSKERIEFFMENISPSQSTAEWVKYYEENVVQYTDFRIVDDTRLT